MPRLIHAYQAPCPGLSVCRKGSRPSSNGLDELTGRTIGASRALGRSSRLRRRVWRVFERSCSAARHRGAAFYGQSEPPDDQSGDLDRLQWLSGVDVRAGR